MPSLTGLFVEPLYRVIHGRPARSTEEDAGGRVLVLGGVGRLDILGVGLRYAAGAAGLPYRVEIFPWGHGFGRWYADLTGVDSRDRDAARLAEEIRRHRTDRPGSPLFIVARSAGAGIAVMALEKLDADTVERVILLAPALSPAYDLRRALRAVRHEMVVFWSPADLIILGAGTCLFGTIDRVRTIGAGLVGFRVPASDGPGDDRTRQYQKLRQVRWSPGMIALGHFGGHFGADSPGFLRKYVVPLLRVDSGPDAPT
ncbi:MAG: serine aminopeptidase domain-containing protein [Isosphaeraceae bacterium]